MSTTRNPDEGPEQAVLNPQETPTVPAAPVPETDPRTVEAPLIDPSIAQTIELVEIGEVASPTVPSAPESDEAQREPDVRPYRGLRPKIAERLITAVAIAIPFMQAPGLMFTDSRSDLTVNPSLFLSRVLQVWSSTYDLGHVQSGQFVGYIFPMAPFYAGGAATGAPMWIVQRVWLALILLAAGIGVSRLIGALWRKDDGLARLLGGLVYVLNPYVVTQLNRGTITLTAYAVLPWLLYAAHRGMLEPRRWRWPIAAGFFVAMAGGGVNAAVLLWVMLAPLLLVIYEVAVIGRSRIAAWSLLWRTGICVLLLSLWWIIPTTLQSKFGADFLSFTEQPSTIWETNSVSESLRLLGYWISYFQIGFGASRPVVPPTTVYLFAPLLVAGSFAVPVLAFSFLSITWRRPYVPFFVLLAVGAIIAMAVGFPPGKPLNRLLVRAYYDFPLLQILRTTYKAAPLLAVALAVLVGTGGAAAIRRIRLVNNRRAAIAGLMAAPILFGWPLVTGTALDSALTYKKVPSYWREASGDLERYTGPGNRAMMLPGQQFGVYRWGTTFDPVAPALTKTSVAQRYAVRYADPHSSQLLSAVDNLVQQRRLVPGQLDQMLSLLGVGQVLVGADGIPESSGELDPASAKAALATSSALRRPAQTYGPKLTVSPAVGRSGNAVSMPAISRYELPGNGTTANSLVRAHPRSRTQLVSGDANGLLELAAHGMINPANAILFSGDQTRPGIRRQVRDGAGLVITDTNRRQVVLATRTTHDQGSVLSTKDRIAPEVPSYDLFAGIGNAKQTVAVYTGIESVTNPEGPQLLLRPEARPFAAVDGDLRTSWTPANFLPEKRWIEITLKRSTKVGAIRIHPHRDSLVQTTKVGVSIDGSPERAILLLPGWNNVATGDAPVRKIRVRILHTSTFGGIDLGGIDEISIPGLKPREWLRTPIWSAQALAAEDMSRTPIDILLARQTTSDPYRSSGAFGGPVPTGDPKATFDAERGINRLVSVPSTRSFSASGWASSAPWTPDFRLDALVGLSRGWRFDGSPRFEGVPIHRSSSAFDRNPRTAWVAEDRPGVKPWIAWRSPRPVRMTRFRLVPYSPLYRTPTQVRVSFGGLSTSPLPVGRDGEVLLPQAVRSNRVRIDFVKTSSPKGPAELRLLPAMAISEIVVAGMNAPRARHGGRFATRCGDLRIEGSGSMLLGRVRGRVADLDLAKPMRFEPCGADRRLTLIGGPNPITVSPGPVMRIDHLRLSSEAPRPRLPATSAQVVTAKPGPDGFAEVRFSGPGWLVHGDSFSTGWRATCGPTRENQKDLGAPRVLDGFAAGWRVGSKCRFATFKFVPQSTANQAYIASAGAAVIFLLMLGGSLFTDRRRRLAGAPDAIVPEPMPAPGDDKLAHSRRQFAAITPLLAGGVAAALFALRVGPPAAIIALLLGIWGVNVRRLYRLAAGALILVPVAYLALTPKNKSGGNFYYAVEQIGAHWLATIAILLAGSGAALTALRIRWSTHPRAGRWSLRRVRLTVRQRRIRRNVDSGGSRSSRREPPGPEGSD